MKLVGTLFANPAWRKTLVRTFTKAILKRCYATSSLGAHVKISCAAHISEYVGRLCSVMESHEDDEIYTVLSRFADSLVQHPQSGFRRAYERVQAVERVVYASGWVVTPETHILDVGCGDGEIVCAVGERFGLRMVYGTDLLSGLPVVAGREYATLIDYRQATKTGYPFATHSMDVILLFVALHHIMQPAYIADIARILRPGGLLIIREHDCRSEETAQYLDIVHAADAVITRMQTWSAFNAEHMANYMSRGDVLRLFPDFTVAYMEEYPSPNPQRLYHLGLRKGELRSEREALPPSRDAAEPRHP